METFLLSSLPDKSCCQELSIDCTQLDPGDRPTAHAFVSSKNWEDQVLPAISHIGEDSQDEPIEADQVKGSQVDIWPDYASE